MIYYCSKSALLVCVYTYGTYGTAKRLEIAVCFIYSNGSYKNPVHKLPYYGVVMYDAVSQHCLHVVLFVVLLHVLVFFHISKTTSLSYQIKVAQVER